MTQTLHPVPRMRIIARVGIPEEIHASGLVVARIRGGRGGAAHSGPHPFRIVRDPRARIAGGRIVTRARRNLSPATLARIARGIAQRLAGESTNGERKG